MSTDQEKPSKGDANCPSCGYFVGGASKCPRCGNSVESSTSLFLAKTVAILGSILGVIFLWGYTRYVHQIPEIQIAQINEAMNGALVRLEGRVTDVDISERDNNFTITVSQGPDDIDLRAFDELADFRQYHGDAFPPNFFDKVRVTSPINIHPQFGASMFLSIPDRLTVVEPWHEAELHYPSTLTEENIGSYYLTEGTVMEVRRPGNLRVLTFADSQGEREFVIRDFHYDRLSPQLQEAITTPGSRIRAVVEVDEFRGEIQLQLGDPETITVVGSN